MVGRHVRLLGPKAHSTACFTTTRYPAPSPVKQLSTAALGCADGMDLKELAEVTKAPVHSILGS